MYTLLIKFLTLFIDNNLRKETIFIQIFNDSVR